MVTNPGEEEREGFTEAFPGYVREVITGSPSGQLRMYVLLVVVGACVAFAPLPLNAIGVIALVLLAMWVR